MIFIIFIYLSTYLFNYLFIRKLYLLEVMLLDWIIKLKRSIIYVLLQIVYFQKVLNVSDMEYFMYPSMFRQFNVYNIVEEPGRMYLFGTLELSTFISKLLVFMWHTLTYKSTSMTSINIAQFWGPLPPLSIYIWNSSTPLTLDVQF